MFAFRNHTIPFATFLLVAVFVTMTIHQWPLTNEHIVFLELCFSKIRLEQLIANTNAYSLFYTFRIHVVYDFLLMLSYVNLLGRLLWMIYDQEKTKGNTAALLLMVLLGCAGMLDGVEDYLMYQYIVAGNWIMGWWWISTIKFLFIGIVVMYVAYYIISNNKKAHH